MKTDKIEFQKSSFSGAYNCVGVSRNDDKILIVNTKTEKIIEFTVSEIASPTIPKKIYQK